jgi:hypothetical protein
LGLGAAAPSTRPLAKRVYDFFRFSRKPQKSKNSMSNPSFVDKYFSVADDENDDDKNNENTETA